MAFPNRVRPRRAVIKMGDGASPEIFTLICGLDAPSFTAQTNTTDDFVYDCADPESIPVRFAIVTGEQWDLSGSGLANLDNIDTLYAAKGVTKNYQFVLEVATGQTGQEVTFEGPAILTNIQIGGSETAFATVQLSFVSDGVWEKV